MNGRGQDVQDHTAKFPGTRWSLVAAAADVDRAGNSRAALSTLCEMYWYPLYAFVRRRGFEPDEAQDLTQGLSEAEAINRPMPRPVC